MNPNDCDWLAIVVPLHLEFFFDPLRGRRKQTVLGALSEECRKFANSRMLV